MNGQLLLERFSGLHDLVLDIHFVFKQFFKFWNFCLKFKKGCVRVSDRPHGMGLAGTRVVVR
jgi:hypothetical protein